MPPSIKIKIPSGIDCHGYDTNWNNDKLTLTAETHGLDGVEIVWSFLFIIDAGTFKTYVSGVSLDKDGKSGEQAVITMPRGSGERHAFIRAKAGEYSDIVCVIRGFTGMSPCGPA